VNDCRDRSSRPRGRQWTRQRPHVLGLVVLLWAVLAVRVYAAPPAQGSETIHVVQAGETLFGIAQRYGTTVDFLVALNGLSDPNLVVAGQRLLIPAAGAEIAEYTVQPGDTLAIIARRYGVTTEEVARLNRLANPSLIYVGQRLVIPSKGSRPIADDSSPTGALPTAQRPSGGQVHVVQSGDTLARIAARYGISVWSLAQANQIANPSVIHVGQRLLVPTAEGSSNLPPPFLKLDVVPAVAVQGRTVQVWIEMDGDASLSGQFDGRPLFFANVDRQVHTLIAIPAMAAPGPYPLEITAVQGVRQASVSSMLYVTPGDFGVQYISLSADKERLLDPELVAQEGRRIHEVTAQPTLPGLWQGPFAVPLAGAPALSAPFGGRRSYNGGPVSSYHAGVDYSVGAGTPVLSPASGRVVLAEALQVRGNAVIVDHGRGVMSGYWHLAQVNVVEGQMVEPGTVLGLVGSTGLSTGAHLHWEMRVMGIPVDPLQWVREEIR
jgi:murein DD-endopeptidase MepM/ murein hydrolase activator NlpD